MTAEQRLLAIIRQVSDASGAIALAQGNLEDCGHGYREPKHRIACILADVLVLCQEQGVDAEHELLKVQQWFEQRRAPP